MIQRQFVFHPVSVLVVSVIASAIFAFFINLLFTGERRWFLLYYFTPIGIPFVAFLFDRAEQYTSAFIASWVIDLVILIAALARTTALIPLISGHALFLSYALLTSRSKVARISAFLVLLQVAYLKIFIWHDVTLIGGIVVGCLAALLYWRGKLVKKNVETGNGL